MADTEDYYVLGGLAEGLSAVAARLEPKEASRYCAVAAVVLKQTITKTSDRYALHCLAEGLSAVAARLETKEASLLCAKPPHSSPLP